MNERNFGQQDSGLTRVTFFECQADELVSSLQDWFEPKDRLERYVSRNWNEVWTKIDFPFNPGTHFVVQQCEKWSAHCDNGRSVISGLPYTLGHRLRCRSIRFAVHDKDANGYPLYAFEYFDGRNGPGPVTGRTVMLAEDGRLKFSADGEVAEFESPENYSKRRKVDRINLEILSTYATRMGINLLFVPDQDFYVFVDRLARKANANTGVVYEIR